MEKSPYHGHSSYGHISYIIWYIFTYSWTFLFRKREALSEVPDGSNLVTAGFVQVSRTCKGLWSRYHALRWFIISLLWVPVAGSGVVLSIIVTFLTAHIEMNSQQIAYTALIAVASNLPGSLVAKWVCQRFNPLFSYRASLLFFVGSIAAASGTLAGPEMLIWAYFLAFLWGFGQGVLYPSQRVLFCTLIPKLQETEFMGVFIFAGEIIGWLPSVVFTLMNQQQVDMRWSFSILAFFTAFSFLCTLPMGSYDGAVQQVAKEPEELANGQMSMVISTPPDRNSESGSEDMEKVDDEEQR